MSDIKFGNYDEDTGYEIEDQKLLEAYNYVAEIPGKKVRMRFAEALNDTFRISEDQMRQIENILNKLHTCSLLFDDIEDASVLRRGFPTAHLMFGVRSTFSAARYSLILCYKDSLDSGSREICEIVMRYTLEMHRGQAKEVYWRDNSICPSIEEYKQMASEKTNMFTLIAELMQVFSDHKADAINFAKLFGLFFQIRDDYSNLCSEEYAANKTFCEDISEGKFSFPVVHAIQTRPDDKRVINILKEKTTNTDTKKKCLSLLQEFGSFDYTYDTLMEIKKELLKDIGNLAGNKVLMHVLENVLKIEKNRFE